MALPELADGAESKQKVRLVGHQATKRGKGDYLEITYVRLDGQATGAEVKTGAFIATLDEESKDLIKAGGEVVITKTKSGNFWNLTKVADVSTFVEKPASGYNKSYAGNSGGYTAKNAGNFNNAGIKVGAVLHDAVALAGIGATTAKVKTIAEELLNLSYELEANVNAGKYEPKAAKSAVTATKATPVAQAEEIDSEDLEQIVF
jgi:hypothetical protein